MTVAALQQHVDGSYGSRGGDPQLDGAKRMGLNASPVVQRMASETAIQPGAVFRGYVEDVYQRNDAAGNVGDELVTHWLDNWTHYGSGQALFSWSLFDVPTISEYDPFIRPLYYGFFTRLLNESTDRQLDNYLGATRVNQKVLALMGVRFIVTDRDDVNGLHEVMNWDKFHVLETADPNLATYSPTLVTTVSSAADALTVLASDTFDPQTAVLVNEPAELPRLVAAPPAELRFQRAGFSVRSTSPDWSLIVLPIQYSHCFTISRSSSADARLIRVNLAQTGLLFHNHASVDVEYRHWPQASPECQRRDYADSLTLRVADLRP
jgi:hypothetical protein